MNLDLEYNQASIIIGWRSDKFKYFTISEANTKIKIIPIFESARSGKYYQYYHLKWAR